jgi:hypothetical protein
MKATSHKPSSLRVPAHVAGVLIVAGWTSAWRCIVLIALLAGLTLVSAVGRRLTAIISPQSTAVVKRRGAIDSLLVAARASNTGSQCITLLDHPRFCHAPRASRFSL